VRSLVDLRLDSRLVQIETNPFRLIVAGNWYEAILFEVPLLAIIGEVYYKRSRTGDAASREEGRKRLREKIEYARRMPDPFALIEFGTRRRYGRKWQQEVVRTLKRDLPEMLIGTSNVALARSEELKSFGTMAHQFLQAFQALAPLHRFQKAALEAWMQEYRGDLGIALSDVVGMDAFLRDFDRLFALAYGGCRHDSGDPIEWGEKLLRHYESLAIDPATKTAVFSDSLDFERAFEIARHFQGRIRTQFGIGTNLTNDLGFKPLNIVIKMTECDGQPIAKLSDSPGKTVTQNELYLKYLAQVFGCAV
jgi:nicotinate phosphoribosyltransferase